MRFTRIPGAVATVALLAVLPALGQNTTPQNATPPAAPLPAVPAPTLTPPGSSTSVPLLPSTPDATATTPPLPSTTFPTTGMPTTGMGTYPPLGFPANGSSTALGPSSDDFSSLLSGASHVPLTLTLGQLDANWRRMTITGSLDLGSVTQVVSSLMGSAGIGVYYTQGQTVNVGNTTYLIAYRTEPRVLNVANLLTMAENAMSAAKPPAPETLTRATPLSLSLLNLQTTGSLTDIRPFNLQRELADSRDAVQAYNRLMASFGAMGTPGAPAPKAPRPYHAAPRGKLKKSPVT